jgi:hypothetical protein
MLVGGDGRSRRDLVRVLGLLRVLPIRVFVATGEYIILLFFHGRWLACLQHCAFSIFGSTLKVLAHLDVVLGRRLISFPLAARVYILSYFVLLVYCLIPICMGGGVGS